MRDEAVLPWLEQAASTGAPGSLEDALIAWERAEKAD
jgi:hypothetical protein